MSSRRSTTGIDVTEEFPHLKNAPVVEAVVEWRGEPGVEMEVEPLLDRLKERFPKYVIQPIHDVEARIAGTDSGVEVAKRSQHTGYRLVSEDGCIVCQLRRNAVAVSRLAPYMGWEGFLREAAAFRDVFIDWLAPRQFSRLGVRSINKIAVSPRKSIEKIVQGAPSPWKSFGLESSTFFHQDTILWPDSPYGVRLVRAMDVEGESKSKVLFIDIDITLEDSTSLEEADDRMAEMRFLKNRVFFSTVRDAEKQFG